MVDIAFVAVMGSSHACDGRTDGMATRVRNLQSEAAEMWRGEAGLPTVQEAQR